VNGGNGGSGGGLVVVYDGYHVTVCQGGVIVEYDGGV